MYVEPSMTRRSMLSPEADSKERPAIEGYTLELERNIDWLRENLQMLENRLAAITRPTPVQETVCKEPYSFGSPLASRLNSLNKAVYDMAVQVNNIKESLEI